MSWANRINYENLTTTQKYNYTKKQGKYSIKDIRDMTEKEINKNWEDIKNINFNLGK